MAAADEKKVAELSRSMRVTAGCRFSAARRMTDHDRKLTRLTAFTSAYVILLTFVPYVWMVGENVKAILDISIVVLSVVILVSSLLQYSSGEIVNAEQHHRCALEINELYRALHFFPSPVSEDDLKKTSEKYNAVLQKYSINHDDIDYFSYQLKKPDDFPRLTVSETVILKARLFFARHMPTFWLMVVTTFSIALMLYVYRAHTNIGA